MFIVEFTFAIICLLLSSVLIYFHYIIDSTTLIEKILNPEMLAANICIVVLFIIGFVLFILCAKKIIKKICFETKGIKTYGVILNLSPTGSYYNSKQEYQGKILVVTKSHSTIALTTLVGCDISMYQPGKYVLVKHYKNEIKLINPVLQSEISSSDLLLLNNRAVITPFDNKTHADSEYLDGELLDDDFFIDDFH